jgi:hypothetical protein
MAPYAPNQLHSVPLAELQPDLMQPRKYLAPLALEELTASVGQVGIIEPIICRQDQATGLVYVVNKLPKEIRDECRQDPTVPRNVLVEIARKKQERSMLTQFKKYRDQQAKTADRQTAASTTRKRTKSEALAGQIGAMQNKIGDLDFPSFSTEDREMVTEALNSLKNTLVEALDRAAQGSQMLA